MSYKSNEIKILTKFKFDDKNQYLTKNIIFY